MRDDASAELPPRVIVIEPDQWTRSLTRAALREIGYDAVGALDPAQAVRQHGRAGGRGPVRVVIIDQDTASDQRAVQSMHEALGTPATILVRRPTRAERAGPWTVVLTRPVSVAQLVDAVRNLDPLPADAQHPVDDLAEPFDNF